MIILFSPSEAKSNLNIYDHIDKSSFIFTAKYKDIEQALSLYQDYIHNANNNELEKLFGIKNAKQIDNLKKINIFTDKTNKAILRYTGTGYKYLQYDILDKSAQNFIDEHLLIFSNLFGPLLAKDKIPYYKLKQGEKIGNFAFEQYYNERFSNILDKFLKDKFIVDLRASFYNKFYIPKKDYLSFKFLKNGRVVSHWAKAYRGIIAREIAKSKPKNENEFMKINFENLQIAEIKQIKDKKELIFEILE